MQVRNELERFIGLEFAGVQWCIRRRYDLKQRIGSGTYGLVVSAVDSMDRFSLVAIKKVDGFFHRKHAYEARQILREVRLMRCLNHPNVITLLDVMIPPLKGTIPQGVAQEIVSPLLSELYLVTELMSTDLRHILSAAHRPGSTFSLRPEQAQYLLYQLICGLQYIGSAGVLHRDLKPSNLLVDLRSCQLRICDFGLARAIPTHKRQTQDQCCSVYEGNFGAGHTNSQATMTEYVVTRCYRAPEILLGNVHYGPGVDIWSVGCILAEMLAPNMGVLFQGTERREMLTHIVGVLGRPSKTELWFISDENASNFMDSLPLLMPQTLKRRISSHCSPSEVAVRSLHLEYHPHPHPRTRSLISSTICWCLIPLLVSTHKMLSFTPS